ncbi:MAG TPA: multidrug efflux RND transporter permease subunit [Paracoccaceae bacterium]|nr:multidrug efflux RND transporter permease subunit [Paracoccaceae bacterium]
MRFSRLFIDRPIFAAVLSILIVLIGGAAFVTLPIAQYPEIAPPTVVVRANYPGASAEVVAATVATPLEQEINGVENMLYMSSQSTGDGAMGLTVTFALGTDLDEAQVLVQNRVSIATPRLPEEVRRIGVTVRKNSPDLMMVVHVVSPDHTRDQLYLSNYATLQIKDRLARLEGVGDVRIFGARDYSMRIWLDPERVAARGLTATEVVEALRTQNTQVAAGVLNQPPIDQPGAFQLNVETRGRLFEPRDFERIIVKSDGEGRVTRLSDIGRVELGAQDYGLTSYLDDNDAVAVAIFQQPGSNALETASAVIGLMDELARDFPTGVAHEIVYNPTTFIQQSVDAVFTTIEEAVLLVVLVVLLFLQSWRAAIIPILAIPISLVGTFAVLAALGYSLNTLSLFGLVLAIGIVVDDAIVVVENVERHLAAGMAPREATRRAMDEVGGALIAIALVLAAVFIPAAFVSGIQGQFFRQFAVTIATATAISAFVSLTLSPALCAMLLRPHGGHEPRGPLAVLTWPARMFFKGFNWAFDRLSMGYGGLTRRLIRLSVLVLIVYGGLIVLTGWQFERAPTGFIPDQDQGYMITVVQLPPGSSLARTDAVVREMTTRLRSIDGVERTVAFSGLDGATFTQASNAAAIFSTFKPFEERLPQGRTSQAIIGESYAVLGDIQEAMIFSLAPPPVRGIGNTGGFKIMVEDRRSRGLAALEEAAWTLAGAANSDSGLAQVFTFFNTRTPKIFAEIDIVRAEILGVPPENVNQTLEIYLGSSYVNDFNFLGRTYRVTAQAESEARQSVEAIGRYRVMNRQGELVPLSAVADFADRTGPYLVERFNLYPAAAVQGSVRPGFSTGYGLERMEEIAAQVLPDGFANEWTELSLQQKLAGDTGLLVFGASVVFVFLLLAAQYESWSLPFVVILIVPMCLLAAVTGLLIAGLSVDILAQTGLIVLVGLAAKNAILIVEFARQAEAEEGHSPANAAAMAAQVRLRPILMTSFAFILGVVPLVIATGAGAEMRQSLGIAVFSGMLGVTAFGLLFTPVFYAAVRWLTGARGRAPATA